MSSQRYRIGRGHDRNVDVLSQMMSDTIPTIDPERAHWARRSVLLPEHKLIDDQRTIRRAEEFAQADGADRRVAGIEVRRTLFECIILNRRALWKRRGEVLLLALAGASAQFPPVEVLLAWTDICRIRSANWFVDASH